MKITDIFEAFDYQADITWKADIGYFTINNQQYEVTVRPAREDEKHTLKPFFEEFNNLSIGNIDFSLILPNGVKQQDSVGYVGASAPKVFAAVAQAVTVLRAKHNYDILLAIAKKQHSPTNFASRVSAYARIVDFLSRKAGMSYLELAARPQFVVFVVFAPRLIDSMVRVQQHLNQYYNTSSS